MDLRVRWYSIALPILVNAFQSPIGNGTPDCRSDTVLFRLHEVVFRIGMRQVIQTEKAAVQPIPNDLEICQNPALVTSAGDNERRKGDLPTLQASPP